MTLFSPLRLLVSRNSEHQDVFLRRYRTLLAHAVKLTRGNRDLADDLLQDAFISFTEARADLNQIDNLDAYLFSMVKYLHLARVKRGMRDPLGDLAIVDYESAELSLTAAPSASLSTVYEQLIRICEFAFNRRNESRQQSLLLLRFLHGYYLDELAVLAGNSKPTIRKWLQEAQSEVRETLNSSPSAGKAFRSRWTDSIKFSSSHEEFLQALREHLLGFGERDCPERTVLTDIYRGARSDVSTELLGHLAVCRSCLDGANRLLGLPLLALRHSSEVDGRGRRNGPGGSSTGGGHFDLHRARRRAQALTQHEPRKLVIRIDGIERAEHDIALLNSRFALKLGAEERMHWVEVVSEQGLCLLSFFVPEFEPGEPLEMHRERRMSGERTIAATVRYAETWPSIEVSYRDPESCSIEAPSDQSASPVDRQRQANARSTWGRLRSWLDHLVEQPASKMPSLFATAAVLGIASILCFAVWWKTIPRISANVLLTRAEAWDASAGTKKTPGVIYQKVAIRTARRTVERAIYRDPQGIRQPRRQSLSPEDEQLKNSLATAGVNWDAPLSAADYAVWRHHLGATNDRVAQSGPHLLTLTTTPLADNAILKETLTVRDTDFHAVDRTVELRDTGTVEIAELNYDVMPWGAVNQDWFEPILGQPTGDLERPHPLLTATPRVMSGSELNDAELSVRLVLNQLHADEGEQILVSRSTNGIEVKGVVDTDQRKEQLAAHLLQISHVHLSLLSVEEFGSHPQLVQPQTSWSVQTYSMEPRPSPVEQYLRARDLPLDQAASISQGLLDQSLRILQAETHLSELQKRFDASQLSADQQIKFMKLSQSYVHAIEDGLDATRRLLLSIGLDNSEELSSPVESGMSGEDIDRQVRRYQELCQQLASSGNEEGKSAETIAGELRSLGPLIRSGAANIGASASTAHN